ncbi:hypothetical protein F4810DRAFT_363935 [Camillea tinctor]|nr:hypothetical protein F4810DRAFT_363935 [Camillea tinctor]
MDSVPIGAISGTMTNPDSIKAYINNSKLPFFQLSIELRKMIYEYVVALEQPIYPRQVTDRSNKFVWGNWCREQEPGSYPGRFLDILVPNCEPLMITQLMTTCRHMYWDLTNNPVFYQVNEFAFATPSMIHRFLAAITPQRRKAIQKIIFEKYTASSMFFVDHDIRTMLNQSMTDKHVMTLLQDCTALKSIKIRLMYRSRADIGPLASNIIQHINSPSAMSSIWKFPIGIYFRPFGEIGDRDLDQPHFGLPGNLPSRNLLLEWYLIEPPIRSLLIEANSLIKNHNAERERQRRVQVITSPLKEELHMAIEAAGIDFPGESRVHYIRSMGMNDPVSGQSREEARAENNVTPWGTIKKILPKYNLKGILLWPYVQVLGLRWKGPSIEAEVRWPTPWDARYPTSSWEDIRRLGNWDGLKKIYIFFWGITRDFDVTMEFIEMMEKMPTPEDVEVALEGLLDENSPEARLNEWAIFKETYKADFDWLKNCIIQRNKLAAEQLEKLKARKAARAEAAAARKQERASRAKKNAAKNVAKSQVREGYTLRSRCTLRSRYMLRKLRK